MFVLKLATEQQHLILKKLKTPNRSENINKLPNEYFHEVECTPHNLIY